SSNFKILLARHWTFRKQLHNVVRQAVIQQLLECPRKLRTLDIALDKCNPIFRRMDIPDLRPDHHFHAVALLPRLELEERMLILRKLFADALERTHFGLSFLTT